MIGSFLNKAALTAAAMMTLTSCGKTVSLMDPEKVLTVTGEATTAEAATTVTTTAEPTTEPPTEPFSVDVSIPKSFELPVKYAIEGFETVLQNPELPTGCEVTALCEVLNFHGFGIDKVELADEFMPIDFDGVVTMASAYVGDPKAKNGFGCNAPVIVQTADDYFESIDSPCYAVDLTDTELSDLFYQITQGRPVVTWVTIDLKEAYPNYKWSTPDGEEMWFDDYQHCLAIYGFDFEENVVHAADPMVGNIKYDMSRFEMIYNIMGKQAVVICGDSETEGSYTPIKDKPQSPMLSRNKAERAKEEEEASRAAAEAAEEETTEG